MKRTADLITRLLSDQRPRLGEPGRIGQEHGSEVCLVLGNGNVKLISFTREGYETFAGHFSEHRRAMPEKVFRKLPEPARLPVLSGRKPDLNAKSGAAIHQGRVYLPLQTVMDVWEWLHEGKVGSGSGSVRNALQRSLSSPAAAPPLVVVRVPPVPPAPPHAAPIRVLADEEMLPGDEKLADLGLEELSTCFDVEVVKLNQVPLPKQLVDLVADGSDREELLTWPDADGPGAIWIIEDKAGYHAALLGPKIARAYEERIRVSAVGFRLPSITHSLLRGTRDLNGALHRSGGLGAGYLLVTTHGDRAIGAVVDIEKLKLILGLSDPTP